MKKKTIVKVLMLLVLGIGINAQVYAKQLEGSTALNQGIYREGSTSAPGYFCDYHNWMACCFYTPDPGPWPGSGIQVNFYDDWILSGKLRMVFQAPWGASQCEFNHDTQLPSFIATQLGFPALKVVTGIYPITITPAYPNGYVDLNFTP